MQIGVETSRSVENKRIFVVHNDDITRTVLQFMLHDENETHELGSLAEAYAKGVEWKPDLILLGLSIVETDGTGVLVNISAHFPGCKILLVAEPGQDAQAHSHLKSGAHGVLTKPLTVESVRRRVDMVLGRLAVPMIQLQMI